ncbi:hypothetical protein FDUTEX481_03444 [Tolypothrix sp. PCC 7601]|nr:hypothetical protein FDUTEX481_03444 [Tolypothrix sp. PCC 7601]
MVIQTGNFNFTHPITNLPNLSVFITYPYTDVIYSCLRLITDFNCQGYCWRSSAAFNPCSNSSAS